MGVTPLERTTRHSPGGGLGSFAGAKHQVTTDGPVGALPGGGRHRHRLLHLPVRTPRVVAVADRRGAVDRAPYRNLHAVIACTPSYLGQRHITATIRHCNVFGRTYLPFSGVLLTHRKRCGHDPWHSVSRERRPRRMRSKSTKRAEHDSHSQTLRCRAELDGAPELVRVAPTPATTILGGIQHRVALDVADRADRVGDAPHERPVLVEPVAVELVFRHVLAAADAVHELDHPGDSTPVGRCGRYSGHRGSQPGLPRLTQPEPTSGRASLHRYSPGGEYD